MEYNLTWKEGSSSTLLLKNVQCYLSKVKHIFRNNEIVVSIIRKKCKFLMYLDEIHMLDRKGYY